MYCLHCDWQTSTNLHGTDAHDPTHRVAVRFGILTTETVDKPVIAMATNDQESVALTRDVAGRLIADLKNIIARHDALTAKRETQRQETARRLVDAAVLTETNWRAVLDGLASGNTARRDAAIAALRDCAPPRWLATAVPRVQSVVPE